MRSLPEDSAAASIAAEMKQIETLDWALRPPGLPSLDSRVTALEEHLRLALTELRLLGDEASWMMREAEGAFDLALALLVEERTGVGSGPTRLV